MADENGAVAILTTLKIEVHFLKLLLSSLPENENFDEVAGGNENVQASESLPRFYKGMNPDKPQKPLIK